MSTISPPTGMSFKATYRTEALLLRHWKCIVHETCIMVSQFAISLLGPILLSTSTSIKNNRQKIIRGFGQTSSSDLLDPAHWPHPEIPSCRQIQMLWILTLVCFQTVVGDFWLQHVPPDLTIEVAKCINEGKLSASWCDVLVSTLAHVVTLPKRECVSQSSYMAVGCWLWTERSCLWRHAQFIGAFMPRAPCTLLIGEIMRTASFQCGSTWFNSGPGLTYILLLLSLESFLSRDTLFLIPRRHK